jgi:hypothetical protein
MKKTLLLSAFILFFFPLILNFQTIPAKSEAEKALLSPTPQPEASIEDQVIRAIYNSITTAKTIAPVYGLFETRVENVRLTSTQDRAVAWLIPVDPETKEVIPTEPGLAVVQWVDNKWDASLPGDQDWFTIINQLPEDLLSEPEKTFYVERAAQMKALAALGPFGGYRLPWAPGQVMAMTQSVAHDRYTPSLNAHYAFDFATPGTAQMFNLYAAKAGRVWMVKDTCNNGSETCSNWIVLEDKSTNPTTYQLYLHLAKGSIPNDLRTIGTQVARGQFIGVADDTGVSTAHHLHFMVHTTPTSYWGTSVDITFEDVSINGGRPRITADKPYCRNDATYHDVCEQFSSTYTSANYYLNDNIAPQGDILSPLMGETIYNSIVHLEGWALDDRSGISAVRFIVNYDGTWRDIGPTFTTNLFSYDWDMQSAGVPDGPISVALKIFDKAGNQAPALTGLRHFIKTPNQSALRATFIQPSSGQNLRGDVITLNIGILQGSTTINRAQFYWHPGNWSSGGWIFLGEDNSSNNGWSYDFNLSQISYQLGIAFYARVFDSNNNSLGIAVWNVNKPRSIYYFPLVKR